MSYLCRVSIRCCGAGWKKLLYRTKPEDIAKLQVRKTGGQMVPLGTLVKADHSMGTLRVDRYNMFPAVRILGEGAPGVSSGQALHTMENLARKRCRQAWATNGRAWRTRKKRWADKVYLVFGMAVLIVVLILAAQYESWVDPIAVVTVVPLAVLGAVVGLMLQGMDHNLYTQVGLVLLAGLSAKTRSS